MTRGIKLNSLKETLGCRHTHTQYYHNNPWNHAVSLNPGLGAANDDLCKQWLFSFLMKSFCLPKFKTDHVITGVMTPSPGSGNIYSVSSSFRTFLPLQYMLKGHFGLMLLKVENLLQVLMHGEDVALLYFSVPILSFSTSYSPAVGCAVPIACTASGCLLDIIWSVTAPFPHLGNNLFVTGSREFPTVAHRWQ